MRLSSALTLLALSMQLLPASAHDVGLVPPSNAYPASNDAVIQYAARPEWKTEMLQSRAGGKLVPQALRVVVPSPFSGGDTLAHSVLPTEPQSSIYRFKYLNPPASASQLLPFQLLEIDWNTEGQPRGPNGSFITPHYDFHFYTKPGAFVDKRMDCVTSGKTCDPQKTGYAQMRRFLKLPPDRFIPASEFPDTDSSITAMGLHSLDGGFDFTVDSVNHNPVIIYGSFDGEIAFLEASMTLYAFTDAIEKSATGQKSSWKINQPKAYAYHWWPTSMSLEYIPRDKVFYVELNGFEAHAVEPYKNTPAAKK